MRITILIISITLTNISYPQKDSCLYSISGFLVDTVLNEHVSNTIIVIITDDGQTIKSTTNNDGYYKIYFSGSNQLNEFLLYTQGGLVTPTKNFISIDSFMNNKLNFNIRAESSRVCVDTFLPNIFFSQNSSIIEYGELQKINNIIEVLKDNPNLGIVIKGYSNFDEPDSLSITRKSKVYKYINHKMVTNTEKVTLSDSIDNPRLLNRYSDGCFYYHLIGQPADTLNEKYFNNLTDTIKKKNELLYTKSVYFQWKQL